jgi:hypothetical protein
MSAWSSAGRSSPVNIHQSPLYSTTSASNRTLSLRMPVKLASPPMAAFTTALSTSPGSPTRPTGSPAEAREMGEETGTA